MKIVVGGTYETRKGRIVHVDFYTCTGTYVGRYIDGPPSTKKLTIRWDINGRYDSVSGRQQGRDIVKKASLDFSH